MKSNYVVVIVLLGLMMLSGVVEAQATAMPWDSGLMTVKDSLTGTTATIVSILAVLGAGLGLAFGEGGGGAKKLLMVVMGIGIALGAAKIVSIFGGGGSGCSFPAQPVAIKQIHAGYVDCKGLVRGYNGKGRI